MSQSRWDRFQVRWYRFWLRFVPQRWWFERVDEAGLCINCQCRPKRGQGGHFCAACIEALSPKRPVKDGPQA
jgi:hypothetical protein